MLRWALAGCAVLSVRGQDEDTMIIGSNVRTTRDASDDAYVQARADFLSDINFSFGGTDAQKQAYEVTKHMLSTFCGNNVVGGNAALAGHANAIMTTFSNMFSDNAMEGVCAYNDAYGAIIAGRKWSHFSDDTDDFMIFDDSDDAANEWLSLTGGAQGTEELTDQEKADLMAKPSVGANIAAAQNANDMNNYVIIKVDHVVDVSMKMVSDDGAQYFLAAYMLPYTLNLAGTGSGDLIEQITAHGCWCSRLAVDMEHDPDAHPTGGTPVSSLDEICKEWFIARHCARVSTTCNVTPLVEYEASFAVSLQEPSDEEQEAISASGPFKHHTCLNNGGAELCPRAACEIDSHFAFEIEKQIRIDGGVEATNVECVHSHDFSMRALNLNQHPKIERQDAYKDLTDEEIAMLRVLEDGVEFAGCQRYHTIIDRSKTALSVLDWSYVGNSAGAGR